MRFPDDRCGIEDCVEVFYSRKAVHWPPCGGQSQRPQMRSLVRPASCVPPSQADAVSDYEGDRLTSHCLIER